MPSLGMRVLNGLMATTLRAAPATPYSEGRTALRVLKVRGRRSGREIATPVGVLLHGGRHHLVAPDRARDWVKNLAEAGRCAVEAGRRTERYESVLLDHAEALPLLRAYVGTVPPRIAALFPFAPDAPDEHLREAARQTAVFRLHPVDAE